MKRMSKKVALGLVLVLCLVSLPLAADDNAALEAPAKLFPDAVGASVNSQTFGGLSYQHWEGRTGYALTVGGMILPQNYSSYSSGFSTSAADFYSWNYTIEADGFYKLFSSTFWNWLAGDLYLWVLLAHQGGVQTVDLSDFSVTPSILRFEPGPFVPSFSLGVGIGYEIIIFRHFSIPFQFGYILRYPLSLMPNVATSFRYRF